jgi:hypothetical protein
MGDKVSKVGEKAKLRGIRAGRALVDLNSVTIGSSPKVR